MSLRTASLEMGFRVGHRSLGAAPKGVTWLSNLESITIVEGGSRVQLGKLAGHYGKDRDQG